MVDTVMPCGFRLFFVAVIAEEESLRTGFAAYNYLSCFTYRNGIAVFVHKVNVVERGRLAHGAGLRCHAGKICEHSGGLGLTESLHKLQTRKFQPAVEYLRVQRLTRDTAVLET